jgi:hypothetical protein
MIRNNFTMNTATLTLKNRFLIASLTILGSLLLGFLASSVYAQTPSVLLSVNGNASVNAAPGTQVTLSWSGVNVSNCSINNGIGAVSVPGTRQVTVPNANITYTITCTGGSDSVLLDIRPSVTVWPQPATVVAEADGSATVRVRWQARNATYCTNLRAETAAGARRTLFTNNRGTDDFFQDNGLRERTKYIITCTNTQTGLSDTDEGWITSFVPYGPPQITAFTVTREAGTNGVYDPKWGGALVEAAYTSVNVDFCERTATQGGVATNIPGWTGASGSWGINGNSQFIFPIAKTTTFKIRCSRNNANHVERTATFTVPVKPTGVSADVPTARIIVPDPATITVPQASNLPARVGVSTVVTNANVCTFTAVRAGTSIPITVPGWTDRNTDWWSREGEFDISLNESARLNLTCTRTSDNAVATDSQTITVTVASLLPKLTFSGEVLGVTNNTPDLRLVWSSQHTNYCNATDVIRNGAVVENWHVGSTPPLGGVHTVDVVGSGEYRITCGNTLTGRSVTEEVMVTIDGSGNASLATSSVTVGGTGVTAGLTASNGVTTSSSTLSSTAGTPVSLTWTSTNATSCQVTKGGGQGFSTGGATSGTDSTITEPVAGLSQDFTVTCYGPTGTSSPATVRVTTGVGVPTATITASANGGPDTAGTLTVNNSANVSVEWSSTDATTCTAGGTGAGFTTGGDPGGTDPVTRPAAGQSRTFTVTCAGPGGTSTPATVTITTSAALPTATITASPTTVAQGSNTTLTWTSTNATACTASGATGWSGSKAIAGGSQSVAVAGDSTYTITCTNGGLSSGPVSVSVNSTSPQDLAGTLDLTAQPTVVRRNATTSLQWSFDPQFLDTAFSPNGCSIQSGPYTSGKLTTATGNTPSPVISAERVFELVCDGVTNSPDDASVRVRIIPLVQES